ncbi:MAG: hypothetical protein RIB61_13380 [Roseicyclus sp.]
MIKIAPLMIAALIVVAIGAQSTPMAEAQSRGAGGGFSETPDGGGSDPDRGNGGSDPDRGDGDGFARTGHGGGGDPTTASNGSFSCPPTSDSEATGVCGLPLLAKDAICNGRGGGSSTGPDGGYVCTVPD